MCRYKCIWIFADLYYLIFCFKLYNLKITECNIIYKLVYVVSVFVQWNFFKYLKVLEKSVFCTWNIKKKAK